MISHDKEGLRGPSLLQSQQINTLSTRMPGASYKISFIHSFTQVFIPTTHMLRERKYTIWDLSKQTVIHKVGGAMLGVTIGCEGSIDWRVQGCQLQEEGSCQVWLTLEMNFLDFQSILWACNMHMNHLGNLVRCKFSSCRWESGCRCVVGRWGGGWGLLVLEPLCVS